jgi:hypothetical protein
MTIDLFVWKAPMAHDPVLAGILLQDHLDGASRFEPSPDLERFTDELTGRFPDVVLERTEGLVVVHLSEEAPDALLEAVPTLAWQHDLVLFDPRADMVQAQRHIPPAPFPRRGLVRAIVAAFVGLAIAVVAYLASIPLLSGVLIVIGGFIVVLALITLPAIVADWRRSHRPTEDARIPHPIARSVPPPEPQPEPEEDPSEVATPTAGMVALREGLRRAGWSVVDGGPPFGPPRVLAERYPPLPTAYVEFVDGLVECVIRDETAWFLARHDFTGRSGSGYRWNEYERMMLSIDSPEERATTMAFWDQHLPILLTVGGDLGYLALALVGSGPGRTWGPVRQAFGPDFDMPTDVSPSFEAFLTTLEQKLEGPDAERALADWLLL